MARCPDCNKFVSFEEQDPEVNDLEVDEGGHVTANVRIVNACGDCGTELTEANLDLETDVKIPKGHTGEGHELEVEEDGAERTSRSGNFKKGVFVPGGGRYAKTFYGAQVSFSVTCECGKLEAVTGELEGDEQASGMESLV